jgi:hypothetical protein
MRSQFGLIALVEFLNSLKKYTGYFKYILVGPMNLVSSIVFIVVVLGIILVVNATFNHKYAPPSAQSLEQQSINMSDIKNLKGEIVSIQNNGSNYPEWIVTGRWKIFQASPESTSNSSSGDIKFNASLTMTSINGTESHRHRLTDFNFSKITFQNRNVIINGTVTLVTLGDKKGILDNNITGIPIGIKIMNLETMSIQIDNKLVREHFGKTLIYAKAG